MTTEECLESSADLRWKYSSRKGWEKRDDNQVNRFASHLLTHGLKRAEAIKQIKRCRELLGVPPECGLVEAIEDVMAHVEELEEFIKAIRP